MCAQRPRAGGGGNSRVSDATPNLTATIAVTAILLLLMAFSVVSWLLDNTTLAAVAGTGACTVAAEAIRRYLGGVAAPVRPRRAVQPAEDAKRGDR